ncbi:hypothetical protein EG328_009661 [Venturia inaequalis]|uniref:Uncharacterized protein n=1 Tax=Venturia inaequalis TaxID=5025 RepID=A0A8H3U7N6_VENIN|nr:hypothetical protein EG328_009661 [Venturia inaequalis]
MPLSSHPPDHDTEKDNEKDIETTTEAIAGVPVSEDAVRRGSVDPSVILKHAIDGDEALKAFANHQGPVVHIDEATNKRLLRKIDMNLMPIMCLVYGLNYLDKTTLSYASVMVKNFAGAVAVRFFLGVFEAAVTPGFALFTSQWYTKREQGLRVNIWFSFNGFAQIFGGLVAYGISKGTENGRSSIAPWKIIFLLTGLLTVTMGIIFLWLMPDNQLNARFLSKEDRILAIERVRENQQGIGNKHFKMYQVKEALTDPLMWAFVFFSLVGDIPNGGISNFFSLLVKSFGYTSQQSLLYATPGGAVEIVALILSGYLGDRYRQRLLVSSFGLLISIVGVVMIIAIPATTPTGRLVGYYMTNAAPTSFVALLSLIATNVAGYTKKTTFAALFLIGYCVGNIIGPQTFRGTDYVPAEITIVVCQGLCLLDLGFIWWWCRRENARKAALRAEPGYQKIENQEWLDLTDRENIEFVYTL